MTGTTASTLVDGLATPCVPIDAGITEQGATLRVWLLIRACRSLAIGVVLPSFLLCVVSEASAQATGGGQAAIAPAHGGAPAKAESTGGVSVKDAAPPTITNDNACPAVVPPATGPEAGTSRGSLAVASSTRWQPVGGEFQFTLTELASKPESVSVWFRWKDYAGPNSKGCIQSTRVQFVSSSSLGDSTSYTYSARLPALDGDAKVFPWTEGLSHRSLTSAVPLADMFVHVDFKNSSGPDTWVLMVGSVGVSTPWIAFVIAAVLVVLAWTLLLRWAAARKVPGELFLRVISTPHGVASLSQFQIVIWTAVIGAGVVYVMMISGNLIDIPTTTLGLLGITGLTLVGSKLQAGSDGTPQRLSAPGAIANLAVTGTPTADTVVLGWSAPAGAVQPFTYTVQMRLHGAGPWTTVASDIGAPPYAVSGLTAATAYDFQVFAINAGGAGPACPSVSATTAAAAAPGVAGPGQVTGLIAAANSDGTVSLTWSGLNPAPNAYVVQYRIAGTLPWATYSNTANTPVVVAGLSAGTTFEFLVFAITGGVAGTPSAVVVAATASRLPRWSDLVMSGDVNVEIDLTRVQMLLFTSIAAAFTGMTLLDTGQIPDIPLGVLALVGLSNGVYLASKAASPTR